MKFRLQELSEIRDLLFGKIKAAPFAIHKDAERYFLEIAHSLPYEIATT